MIFTKFDRYPDFIPKDFLAKPFSMDYIRDKIASNLMGQ